MVVGHLDVRGVVEGEAAMEQVVEKHADRPDVGEGTVVLLAADHLGEGEGEGRGEGEGEMPARGSSYSLRQISSRAEYEGRA